MKTLIDIDNWKRKEQFLFFSKFEEPFFGVTVKVDCTKAYAIAKEKQHSFFLYYLYRALKACNEVENFRYRIIENQVFEFATVNASSTINRPDNTFGFIYINYDDDENQFYQKALEEIENARKTNDLLLSSSEENDIHFSAVPWLDFSSISHARCFSRPDSCPKISFGKITENDGRKEMAVSIHGHHALMDGYHAGLFVEKFQSLLDAE